LVALLTLLCGAILVFSYLSYQEKLSQASSPAPVTGADSERAIEEPKTDIGAPPLTAEQLDGLAANADQKVRDVLKARLDAGDTAQMVVIGSADIQGVADRLANAVHEAYGEFLTVDAFAYDGTSAEFVNDGMQHLAWTNAYDIVVYEPFTLNNNGVVVIEDERAHIAQVEERAMEAVPDAAFLLTPPQPIPNAGYYQTQIQSLKDYARQQSIPLIDHWANWPENPGEYLGESHRPTEQGLDAWANALIDYFVAK